MRVVPLKHGAASNDLITFDHLHKFRLRHFWEIVINERPTKQRKEKEKEN